MSRPSLPAVRQRRAASGRGGHGRRLPLSALRHRLDESSLAASWTLHPEGVLGRALAVPAGSAVTFGLRLTGDVLLSARAMLSPHQWRDGDGALRATAAVLDADGREHKLWSAVLRTSSAGGARSHSLRCQVPVGSTALVLRAQSAEAGSAADALWLSPALTERPLHPLLLRMPRSLRLLRVGADRDRIGDPLISILTPIHDPPAAMLAGTIASVRTQSFADWELCLVDDGCTDPEIVALLEREAAHDLRIKLVRRERAGGVSVATNAALAGATGRYVALLDHDDTLAPDALEQVAKEIAAHPEVDMIYSDEDVIGVDGRVEHHMKPAWSPDLMDALMYTCHLGVFRRELAVALGGFESTFDGCQDYDFVLRLAERSERIRHIPRVLYHWRAHPSSTAGGDQAKPYAYLRQRDAIAEHLQRSGVDASVQFGSIPGLHRIVHRVDPQTSAEIVLAVDDGDGLATAAASLCHQAHPSWRITVAAPDVALDALRAVLAGAGVAADRLTCVPSQPGFDAAAALALAARAATGEHLVLMQAPAAGLTHDWLTRLLGYSGQRRTAAAGPVVLTRDGRILGAGVAMPDGIPLFLHQGSHHSVLVPPSAANVIAVSGVLATRRQTFEGLGGLDPSYGELSLIEYCLRAGGRGERVVVVPDARLRATGGDRSVNDLAAIRRLRETWRRTGTGDPFYNPNYRTDRGDFILRRFG